LSEKINMNSGSGSTSRLLQLCFGYFVFYVINGVAVKFFLSTGEGYPALNGMEYLVYNTAGAALLATGVVLILKWYRIDSLKKINVLGVNIPSELPYILVSGICTAVVVPTTTLLYSFRGISVMVAMIIMRGSVIIIGRLVDAIQIRQGILKKKVYAEENIAMFIALFAVSIKILSGSGDGASPFTSLPVMVIFGSYIFVYSIRIYIMNYYKNTRPSEEKKDNNKSFFAIEQITSFLTMVLVTAAVLIAAKNFGVEGERITPFAQAVFNPDPDWASWAFFAGSAYGIIAFLSVFIFMFKGRTATFAGLANRLTSLIAGTVSTLIIAAFFGGRMPDTIDWVSLGFIFLAIAFMSKAEKKRKCEIGLQKC
jgi:hypothetical protein